MCLPAKHHTDMRQKVLAAFAVLTVVVMVLGGLTAVVAETIPEPRSALTLALVTVLVAGLAGVTARTRWRTDTPYW